MFTGIITHQAVLHKRSDTLFIFETLQSFVAKLSLGTSIAVNGVCLTVSDLPGKNLFSVESMPETEKKTNLQSLRVNELVNIELPATPETFLSGHIVQGHVDGVSEILAIKPDGNSYVFTFSLPAGLSRYIVEKGSIAVNGISLTVIRVTKDTFTVGSIPHTWKHTMLHAAKTGEYVNLEVDVFAKYIERLMKK